MTTLPIHTVQHVKSVFKKYQIIAILFTAVTLITAFLTAVSGFQLAKLRKMQQVQTQTPPKTVQPAPAAANDNLDKQINSLENQLQTEKNTSQELRLKIQELENKITALKSPPPNPEKPGVEKKTTAVLPKLTPPPVQVPAHEPSKAPTQTDIKTSPGIPTAQQPETKSITPAKPTETSPPAVTEPAVQPAPPAAVKDQSLQSPAPSPAINTSAPQAGSPQKIDSSAPAQVSNVTEQAKPKESDATTAVHANSPAKPEVVPGNELQTNPVPEPGSSQP